VVGSVPALPSNPEDANRGNSPPNPPLFARRTIRAVPTTLLGMTSTSPAPLRARLGDDFALEERLLAQIESRPQQNA